MKKYKILNDADGNDEILLESTNADDAKEEALEVLGWTLIVYEEDDDE